MVHFELRDPIHKRIPFDTFEKSIIDHPFFQRLRFIKQLSFILSYVYPGGTQDRFSHCLGAMHIAGRLFHKLIRGSEIVSGALSEEEQRGLYRRIRIAGLLHDIGHGPFSHATESVFPNFQDLPLNWQWWSKKEDRQAKHEDYSVLLIQTLAKEGIFGEDFAQDVCSLIHHDVNPSKSFLEIEKKAPTLHKILQGI
ncbi:MAG: HD domain-containing protein, partial [Patescibacteria group bacterium]